MRGGVSHYETVWHVSWLEIVDTISTTNLCTAVASGIDKRFMGAGVVSFKRKIVGTEFRTCCRLKLKEPWGEPIVRTRRPAPNSKSSLAKVPDELGLLVGVR